jgi:Ion transport protein
MSDYINFETFTSAFITLFTVATGDSWNYTTASFTHGRQADNDCLDNPTYYDYLANNRMTLGCGSRSSALAFFISYMFIVSLIFLKLFIAIILGGYDQTAV